MKKELFSPKGLIWDLDGTLYRFSNAFQMACHHAAAQAAIDAGLDHSFEDALALAKHSKEVFNYSLYIFEKRYGIPYKQLHDPYHQSLDEKIIAVNAETQKAFAESRRPNALITHANRGWALRVLDHLGLRPFFDDRCVFGREAFDFESKAESLKAIQKAAQAIGLKPEDCALMEDDLKNLEMNHRSGAHMVYVHHGHPLDPCPPYVDSQIQSAQDAFSLFAI